MPNIIPPLLSSTPPPIVDDDEEDEFGDFRAGVDLSFGCDGLSLPSSPEHLQKNRLPEESLDVNSNNEEQLKIEENGLKKDYQDKRKDVSHSDITYSAPNGVLSDFSTETDSRSIEEPTCEYNNGSEECDAEKENCSSVTPEICVEVGDDDVQSKNAVVCNRESVTLSEKTSLSENRNDDLHISKHEETKMCNNKSGAECLFKTNTTLEVCEALEPTNIETEEPFEDSSIENVENSNSYENSTILNKESAITDEEYYSDDFGDFEKHFEAKDNGEHATLKNIQTKDDAFASLDSLQETGMKSVPTEDDFGDFAKFPIDLLKTQDYSTNATTQSAWQTSFPDSIKCDNEESGFGDFETCADQSNNVASLKTVNFEDEDDFGDFETCSVNTTAVPQADEEFGDFGSFSTAPHSLESEDIGKKAEDIIKSAFTTKDVEADEYISTNIVEMNSVFDLLKDIMETNALKFQWVNSSSQKTLLKALNIDMRNILYGPGWNLGVPKFAVLEPLKPEILTPEVISPKPPQQTEPVASFPTDVPSVQFDWTSAGLTNPLDSAQNDDQQSSGNINLDWSFLDANTKTDSTQCNVQSTISPATQASPAHSLNLEVNLDSLSLKSEGDDSQRDNLHESMSEEITRIDTLTNMIPLRETHICDESSSKMSSVQENTEDDFDDFQMSLPVVIDNQTAKVVESSPSLTPNLHCLQPIPAEPLRPVVVHQTATLLLPAKIEWPAPGITEDDIHGIELTYTKQPQPKEVETKPLENIKKSSGEDDDWTDFISHKETTRTSPEKVQNNLQLSVFNLSNIQPIKPPVPVITPKGVIQTKLSSSGTMSPLMSSPVHSHRPQQKQLSVKPPDGYKPSIISQQYLDNTNQNRLVATNSSVSLNNYNLYSTPYNQSDSFFVPNAKHSTNSSACDDDDWTDFVSSQPVEQQSVSFTPNIIANPNRYDPLREFRLNGDVLNRRTTQKSSVPSVTNLPDLDFVISKNRTFMKK